MLIASDIGLHLGNRRLLQGIDLSLMAGEVVALVGPNGAGKSTLLKILSGEQAPSQGCVHFQQKNLSDWRRDALAQRLAVLPQKSTLNFPFTGREVVALGRIPHASDSTTNSSVVEAVIDYLQVAHLAGRLYTTLSGGEQQQIQLARVLVQLWPDSTDEPPPQKVLLLDEPSSWFDLAHQQLLVRVVRDLPNKQVSTVLVVHDLNLALACADKVAMLSQGQLFAFGEPKQVLQPALIQQVFGVSARLLQDPNNGQSVLSLIS